MADNQVWATNEHNEKNAFSEICRVLKLISLKLKRFEFLSIVSFLPWKDLKTQDICLCLSRMGKELCSYTELAQLNTSN